MQLICDGQCTNWLTLHFLQSIAFRLRQIYLPKIVRQGGQLSSSPPGSAAHL